MEASEKIRSQSQSTIAKDLNLNLQRVLSEASLEPIEAHLVLLALATSIESRPLAEAATETLLGLMVPSDEIQEAKESAALMAMLNTYYKFRHMIQKPTDYGNAGLRMQSLVKPVLGKHRFEMLAFAISVLNGCETCIRSHEEVLRNEGTNADKIHDLARLASVVKGSALLLS